MDFWVAFWGALLRVVSSTCGELIYGELIFSISKFGSGIRKVHADNQKLEREIRRQQEGERKKEIETDR